MNNEPKFWQIAEDIMEEYDPDPEHARQVTRLSIELFNRIHDAGGLFDDDPSEDTGDEGLSSPDILRLAAMLHDIGWSAPGSSGHHKRSRDMILASDFEDLDDHDRILVAQIARFHRKQHPDPTIHEDFNALDSVDREQVRRLAGVLRIADGLDRDHQSDVDTLDCSIDDSTIRIDVHCDPRQRSAVLFGANLKKALLEEVTGLTVELKAVGDTASRRESNRAENRRERSED